MHAYSWQNLICVLIVIGAVAASTIRAASADDLLDKQLLEAVDAGDQSRAARLLDQGANPLHGLCDFPSGMSPSLPNTQFPICPLNAFDLAFDRKQPLIAKDIAHRLHKFVAPYHWGEGRADTKCVIYTPVGQDDLEITQILFSNGATLVEAEAQCQSVSLFMANSVKMEELLLAHGASVNQTDKDGNTALHLMVRQKVQPDLMAWLLSKGLPVDTKNHAGRTPLHLAVEQANMDAIRFLLDHGANVNAADGQGRRPLHMIASPDRSTNGDWKAIAGLLLDRGADPNARDKTGATPLNLIQTAGLKDVADLLSAKGATLGQVSASNQLAANLKEFREHPDNEDLRKSIIDTVLRMKSPPPIPEEAQKADSLAQYEFRNAKTEDDRDEAVDNFLKAVSYAPWVSSYYYNLCVILEKSVFTRQAIHACKLYLQAAPKASDRIDVETRITILSEKWQKLSSELRARHSASDDLTTTDELYHVGAVTGEIGQYKDVSLSIVADNHASPPRYKIQVNCLKGTNDIWSSSFEIADTHGPGTRNDIGIPLCGEAAVYQTTPNGDGTLHVDSTTGGNLTVRADGRGFVEVKDLLGKSSITTTIDELFSKRHAQLARSPIYSDYGLPQHYYVMAPFGGREEDAGLGFYESDCVGHLLNANTRAMPDIFVPWQKVKQGNFGLTIVSSAGSDACTFRGGASWGAEEK